MTDKYEEKDMENQQEVETLSVAKFERHRVDDFLAIGLGVGAVILLWLLQLLGVY